MASRLIVAAILLVPVTMRAGCSRDVDASVAEFTFRDGSRVDAILALGKQLNMCFGLRNLPRKAFLQPVAFEFQEKSAIEIVQEIFRGQDVQITQSPDGLIKVFRPSKVNSLFDHPISSFEVGRTTLQTLSVGIRIRLERELSPEIQGVAGSYSSGDQTDIVGPFHETDRTVSQLLDLIVSHSKGASWLALVPDSAAVASPPQNMWIVIQYNRPMTDYKALVAAAGAKFPDSDDSE